MDAPKIEVQKISVLSDNHFSLKRYDILYLRENNEWQKQMREVYDCGDGVAALLYNLEKRTIILIRQFRLPTYLNGHEDHFIEVPAGLLEKENPHTRMIMEIEEETGFRIEKVTEVMRAFVSPGANTQKMHLFVAQYSQNDKVSKGGGHPYEGEEIEIIEINFDDAFAMIENFEIQDAKTIILLQYAKLNLFN